MEQLKVAELKAELEKRGLSTQGVPTACMHACGHVHTCAGLKADLVQRLKQEADTKQADTAQSGAH